MRSPSLLCWITLVTTAVAAGDPLRELERQVAEQERQIQRLEVENARLRYLLTEEGHFRGDPLYGTRVSEKPGGATPSRPHDVHVVAVGETLSEIAADRGVTPEAVAALNHLENPSLIRPGQRLQLPEPAAAEADDPPAPPVPQAPPVRQHVVAAGENLYRISLRHEVALDDLLAANPSVDPLRLRVGQKLRIPPLQPMLAGGE